MTNDDLRLLETAFWLYVVGFSLLAIVYLVGQEVYEWRQRRRIRRINDKFRRDR